MDKRPKNFNELVKIARETPDMLGAMSSLGMPLKYVGRTQDGGERYQTTTTTGKNGDLSSVAFVCNSNGSWVVFDNKQRTGKLALDAIAAMTDLFNRSFEDAVMMLAGNGFSSVNTVTKPTYERSHEPTPPTEYKPLPENQNNLRNIFAYLTKARMLPSALVQSLVKADKIYAAEYIKDDKHTPLCAFRIHNEEGKEVGCDTCAANSNVKFKHVVAGSDSNYAWCFSYGVDNVTADTPLFFCESPIDAMSLCALQGESGIYISLCGVKGGTLESVTEKLGGTPIICVDNDAAGNNFAKKYPQYARLVPPNTTHGMEHIKDWNDMLKYFIENNIDYAMNALQTNKTPKKAESVPQKGTLEGETTVIQENAITPERIQQLRSIGRKSVNTFTTQDLQIAKPWQERLDAELGIKSPFFRARFGDWRAYDMTELEFQEVNGEFINLDDIPRGTYNNSDTGWDITVTRNGIDKTTSEKGVGSIEHRALKDIYKMISQAVFLDTVVITEPSKKLGKSSILMHHLYSPVIAKNSQAIAKLYIAEDTEGLRKFYLSKIEIIKKGEAFRAMVPANNALNPRVQDTAGNASTVSIAEIFNFVKENDKLFEANSKKPVLFEPVEVNPEHLNPNGTPKEIYVQEMLHGSILKDKIKILPKEETMSETKEIDKAEQPSVLSDKPSIPSADVQESRQAILKNELKQKVSEAVDRYRSAPRALAEFISFSAKFNNYSAHNRRLIWAQNPNARFVASASYFNAGMPDKNNVPLTNDKIYINKGESALRIWKPYERTYVSIPTEDGRSAVQPYAWLNDKQKQQALAEGWKLDKRIEYTLVPVFDIAQTNAPPEVYPKMFGFGGNQNRNAEAQFTAIKNYCENVLDCPVTVKDIALQKATTKGYFNPGDNSITISDMLSGDGKLSTLIHETAHAELHYDAAVNANKTTAQIELEADMYSLMIESKLGIEPTDSRCDHLAAHYKKYIAEQQANMPEGETFNTQTGGVMYVGTDIISVLVDLKADIARVGNLLKMQQNRLDVIAQNPLLVQSQPEELSAALAETQALREELDELRQATTKIYKEIHQNTKKLNTGR